ncbi:uncharacterized protein LOC143634021 [Bidens hawaiensis]|uniref:uncharacterized protein LOC143634021 n=1 Tax=Bidens hawaiensis TaxID=980011 RepID=UPI00404A6047
MGGKIGNSINRGNAPYTFRLGGENYHSIGSLLPLDGNKPQFSQLYIYDTENEISNRQRVFGESSSDADNYENYIINYLKEMLDSQNPLVHAYHMVRDTFKENPQIDFKLRIVGTRKYDARTYNLPTASEVAALIVGDIGDAMEKRDIIVNSSSGGLRQISELHPSYTPLQFPLLYPFGEDGYKVDIPHRNVDPSSRPNQFSLPLNERRLFQQLLVDKYTMVESQRLHFIRGKQSELRSDTYESLETLRRQEIQMFQHLGSVGYGYPDFFLTITCNPGWPEVKRFLKDTNLNSEDRPDILCRIFKMKLDSMIKLLKDKALFGKIKTAVYTNEFQKHGCLENICFWTREIVQNNTADNEDPQVDEIKAFYDCRYLSACEAAWRIFAFDVHYRVSAVTILPFHLPGQQQVIYGPEEDIEDVLTKTSNSVSMFTGWMEANRNYEHARRLSYAEFPTQFVWKKTSPPKWVERQSGFAIGRIHVVPASFDEAYYLRILLNKVKGPKCFEDIRKVYGFVCDSFRDACYRRGLLDDDKEYIEAIEEASHTANGYYLRNLFATMLITSSLSRPDYVWDNTWQFLVDGILYHQQKKHKNPGLSLGDEQLKNLALLQIEEFLVSNYSSLRRFSHMPFPDQEFVSTSMNPLMMEELSYDKDSLPNDFKLLYTSLTDE